MAGTLVIDQLKASSGVLATQNGMTGIAKAWVNYKGTATVSIRDSFNVSSVTVNGTGLYTINFTTSMTNANFSVASIADDNSGNNPQIITYRSATTSTLLIGTWQSAVGRADTATVSVAIFGS